MLTTRRSRLILNPFVGALTMAVNRSARFVTSLETFLKTVDEAVRKTLSSDTVQLFQQQGRVFDKIVLRRTPKAETEVLFFVRIEDGMIFGPKSDIAPNFNRWYGSIFTAREWNYDDPFHPIPKNPARFKVAGKWGGHVHYIPSGMRKRLSDRKTPLPSEI